MRLDVASISTTCIRDHDYVTEEATALLRALDDFVAKYCPWALETTIKIVGERVELTTASREVSLTEYLKAPKVR